MEPGARKKRGIWPRIGICALDLWTPGLGLLRLEAPRSALLCMLVPAGALLIVILFWSLMPVLGFIPLMACVAVIVIAAVTALVGSIWTSWRWNRSAAPAVRRPWSRWYATPLAGIAAAFVANMLAEAGHRFYKPFYIPSQAMEPTLLVNDRLVASMRAPRSFLRGDVILFANDGPAYVKRIAGLPGDTIALRNGIVILNGRPVPQKLVRVERPPLNRFGEAARRLSEQFPGEKRPHEIYDQGPSPEDDYPETHILPGHLFVLGDNRDDSADSRIPKAEMGVEQLPIADVKGLALYYTWGPSHRSGQPITFDPR
jgi:signal peptidase I